MAAVGLSDAIDFVEIDWYADNDVVRVTARDQLRFNIQKDKAIEALRRAHEAVQFTRQFELLLDNLAKWVNGHRPQVAKAIVTIQDDSLVFVVVQSVSRYDEDLQEELSDLDLSIAGDADLNLVKMRTTLLPLVDDESLRSFLDERMVLLLYHHGQ